MMSETENQQVGDINEAEPIAGQTQFTFGQPLFENQSLPQSPSTAASPDTATPSRRKKTWMLVGGSLAVVLIFVSLLAILPRGSKEQAVQPTPTPTQRPTAEKSMYEQRLDAISEELKYADPARPPLTFPLVDMNIRLEKEAR